MESFWATLKAELVHHEQYATRDEARQSIIQGSRGKLSLATRLLTSLADAGPAYLDAFFRPDEVLGKDGYRHYAVPLSMYYLRAFWYHVVWLWKRSLGRRSQKGYVTWNRMSRLIRRWRPQRRILHPYPSQPLCVMT